MSTNNDKYPQYFNEEEDGDDNDHLQLDNNKEDCNEVEIYSKNAIWGFTIFFSTLFGGILLALNLKASGYKRGALSVVLFTIGYFAMSIMLGAYLANITQYIGLILNIIGGAILNGYFFNKYFPDDDYYPKPIWAPLAVSVLIIIALTVFIYITPGLREHLLTK